MEVSLPASAAIDLSRAKRTAAPAQPMTANAPSMALPLSFVITGLLAFFVGIVLLVAKPEILATYHYNQHVIATTHLFVLGWICSIVMGAMYELVPVALETKLYSEKLARWQFVFHVVGFTGMVWMFWIWNMKNVGHFGSAFAAGVVLFVYNIARTLRRAPKWNVTASAVAAALFWILMAITAGLSIVAAKSLSQVESDGLTGEIVGGGLRSVARVVGRFDAISAMHAHAHLGAIGCFIMLIVGVSYKLVPMFTLSEVQSRRRANCSIALLNIGLAGAFATILIRSPWKLAFAFVIIAALAIYGWEIKAILRARKRKALDWGIKYFITATALLIPLSVIAAALSWPGLPVNRFTGQLENAYGFLGTIGVISFAIIGMLYKIVPFLVWFGKYSRQIGRAKVPALAEMYSARAQAIGYWIYLAGLAVACAGILLSNGTVVRAGSGLLGLSAATLAFNVSMMLSHFFKPKLQPLAAKISPKTS